MRTLFSSLALVALAGLPAWAIPIWAQQRIQEPSRFEDPRPDAATAGAAPLKLAFGGQYVYREEAAPPAGSPSRLVLGQRARTEFTLFSAEEEAALWNLQQSQRERLMAEALARKTSFSTHRSRRLALTGLEWPRVTDDAKTTCVPQLEFANATDWQQHLVCWRKEIRRVE